MRFTLISDDSMVYVDGVAKVVNIPMPHGVHAVQWYGTSGEVEYKTDVTGKKRLNDPLGSLAEYQKYIDAWKNV